MSLASLPTSSLYLIKISCKIGVDFLNARTPTCTEQAVQNLQSCSVQKLNVIQ